MSFSVSSLRPRSPAPTGKVAFETEQYIRSLHNENARLKSACRALEDGLASTASALRRSVENSPAVSPRPSARGTTSNNNLDTSILSDTSTLPYASSSPSLYRSSSPSAYHHHQASMRKQAYETEARLYELQSQLASIETEAMLRRTATNLFDSKVEDLREAFDRKSAELSRTKDVLAASNQHVAELERLLAARPASPGPLERQALESEIQRLRVMLDTSRQGEVRLREENRELNVDLMSTKRALHEARAAAVAQQPSPALAIEVARLQAEIKLKDEQLCSAKVHIQEANYGHARLGRELEALRAELRAANTCQSVGATRESELRTLQTLYRDKRSECSALQAELVEVRSKLFLLESQARRSAY